MDSVSNENTSVDTTTNTETVLHKPPRFFFVRNEVPDRSLIPNRAREIPNLGPDQPQPAIPIIEGHQDQEQYENQVLNHPRPRKIGFLFALLVLVFLASSFASDVASTKYIFDLGDATLKEKKNPANTQALLSSASCYLNNETKIITIICNNGSRQYSLKDLNLLTCRYEY